MTLPPAAGHLVGDLDVLVRRGCKFCTIYADPPWRYDRSPRGAAARHYRTMSVEEIADLPVAKLAADVCHLHLWATHSFLFDAKRVLEAWGFAYKGLFVWAKPHHQMGTGYYWRGAAEFLLLGTKGAQTFLDRSVPNWLCLERTAHSVKPEAVRRLVQRVSPGPYLELFGRRPADGWVVFGDEISLGLFDADVLGLDGPGEGELHGAAADTEREALDRSGSRDRGSTSPLNEKEKNMSGNDNNEPVFEVAAGPDQRRNTEEQLPRREMGQEGGGP